MTDDTMGLRDFTHDPNAKSWVSSANQPRVDFSIQNLPVGIFRPLGSQSAWRGGVAIGDTVVDLAMLSERDCLTGLARQAAKAASDATLNKLMSQGKAAWRALRHGLFRLLQDNAASEVRTTVTSCLVPQSEAEYNLPARVGDYTDFYTSLHHALNIGRLRRPANPLSPNFHWMPIAYHGRASSLVISGSNIVRPHGQRLSPGESVPEVRASNRLDYELELGIWIGPGNSQGEAISIANADDHIFGVSLLNDWSARDIQFWESQPLGPFLGKNFATTLSPWIVTMDALAPFRGIWERSSSHPQPLAYLDSIDVRRHGAIDIWLQASIQSRMAESQGRKPHEISRTTFRHQHWTVAQMVAHHTVNGCNLSPGDLLGSGTVSGPQPEEAGAMIERSLNGQQPVSIGGDETRSFLIDGDTVIFKAWCETPGAARIGFGDCRGTIVSSLEQSLTQGTEAKSQSL